MPRLLFVIVLFAGNPVFSQTEITWETLSDVTFTDKYFEEDDAYYYYPEFGPTVKAMEGKEVFIKGYMLAIDPQQGIYMLSKNPFAACFFCGNSGPETIVEPMLKPNHREFKMDEVVTIKGTLKLNQDDIYHCNYILKGAEVYEQ